MNELADMVGLSHTACWKRLKRLEADGVILARAVIIDPKALGYDVTVLVEVSIAQHDSDMLNKFEDAIQSVPEIQACYETSGDADYILRVIAKDISDYEIILKRTLTKLPGVRSLRSQFTLKTIKSTMVVPIE